MRSRVLRSTEPQSSYSARPEPRAAPLAAPLATPLAAPLATRFVAAARHAPLATPLASCLTTRLLLSRMLPSRYPPAWGRLPPRSPISCPSAWTSSTIGRLPQSHICRGERLRPANQSACPIHPTTRAAHLTRAAACARRTSPVPRLTRAAPLPCRASRKARRVGAVEERRAAD